MGMASNLTPETKKWIDEASYSALLQRWRFSPVGDPMFIGACGAYYDKVMTYKREADLGAAINASKCVGWGYA